MSRHYLVYVKRAIVAPEAEAQDDQRPLAQAFERPAAHAFNVKWFYDAVVEGDEVTIWMLSLLRNDETVLPPSLDARMKVLHKFSAANGAGASPYVADLLRGYNYVFTSAPSEARYYSWNNALSLLAQLRFAGNMQQLPAELLTATPGQNGKPAFSRLPQRLRLPLLLDRPSVQVLESYCRKIASGPKAFVSYRWRDSTPFVVQMVQRLATLGIGCWWDRWSMPRSVAQVQTKLDRNALFEAIDPGIASAGIAVAVNSATYASPESAATVAELQRLQQRHGQGTLRLFMVPEQGKLAPEVALNQDAAGVALELNRLETRLRAAFPNLSEYRSWSI